ncbi:hypothetical protein LTR95_018062 [Oleoguttula sp. CCFEE 5521]
MYGDDEANHATGQDHGSTGERELAAGHHNHRNEGVQQVSYSSARTSRAVVDLRTDTLSTKVLPQPAITEKYQLRHSKEIPTREGSVAETLPSHSLIEGPPSQPPQPLIDDTIESQSHQISTSANNAEQVCETPTYAGDDPFQEARNTKAWSGLPYRSEAAFNTVSDVERNVPPARTVPAVSIALEPESPVGRSVPSGPSHLNVAVQSQCRTKALEGGVMGSRVCSAGDRQMSATSASRKRPADRLMPDEMPKKRHKMALEGLATPPLVVPNSYSVILNAAGCPTLRVRADMTRPLDFGVTIGANISISTAMVDITPTPGYVLDVAMVNDSTDWEDADYPEAKRAKVTIKVRGVLWER